MWVEELNPDSLEELPVLLITEPSFQLRYFFVMWTFILLLIKEMNSSPVNKVFIRNTPLFKDIADILVLKVEMLTRCGFIF